MRSSLHCGRTMPWMLRPALLPEFPGETHPGRADVARARNGITLASLGQVKGELVADFTTLGGARVII
jgi:hypothetical protein